MKKQQKGDKKAWRPRPLAVGVGIAGLVLVLLVGLVLWAGRDSGDSAVEAVIASTEQLAADSKDAAQSRRLQAAATELRQASGREVTFTALQHIYDETTAVGQYDAAAAAAKTARGYTANNDQVMLTYVMQINAAKAAGNTGKVAAYKSEGRRFLASHSGFSGQNKAAYQVLLSDAAAKDSPKRVDASDPPVDTEAGPQ